ncbi:MAG TPA: sirohydrochlorin chelatase [Roseiflexaceae bacterium]|nr:sirohydrochlorin chelatase [Roseiflexaceae bacterium]
MRPTVTQFGSFTRAAGGVYGNDPARAVMLIGHGSLRAGAGAAMIRLAERAQAAGVAPIVSAGFLNYSQPAFGETLAGCVESGASEVIVQPYFLIPGKYVREDLARLAEAGRRAFPRLSIQVAQPFGDHPALARLLLKRAQEADYLAANQHILHQRQPRPIDEGAKWRPLYRLHRTGLLIMAHGSPEPQANAAIYAIARRVRASGRYAAVSVCFMDLNKPRIPDTIDDMARRGIRHMIAAPFFLQLGNHVQDDLPAIIAAARARHQSSTILLAEHLGYDRLLVSVIADRVAEAQIRSADLIKPLA